MIRNWEKNIHKIKSYTIQGKAVFENKERKWGPIRTTTN